MGVPSRIGPFSEGSAGGSGGGDPGGGKGNGKNNGKFASFSTFDRKLEFRAVQKTGRIDDVSISARSLKT
jgi:hypothetical protein